MLVRFAFCEDGGRLINLSLSAPEMFAGTVGDAWFALLASFTLETPKASRFSPAPPDEPEPAAAPPTESEPTPPTASEPTSPTASEPTAILTPAELAALALAGDASTLDQEHPINARLLNNGTGFVPRTVSVDLAGKSARLAAAAVQGIFRVPLGWHVMDDSRRTLVFDAGGRIQVNLSLRAHEGAAITALARQLLEPYLEQQPDLETREFASPGIAGAGVCGVSVAQEILDQVFLVRDVGCDGAYLVARASATTEDLPRALSLAGDILATFERLA